MARITLTILTMESTSIPQYWYNFDFITVNYEVHLSSYHTVLNWHKYTQA